MIEKTTKSVYLRCTRYTVRVFPNVTYLINRTDYTRHRPFDRCRDRQHAADVDELQSNETIRTETRRCRVIRSYGTRRKRPRERPRTRV